MASVTDKRWCCVDPGETTGWSMWNGARCIGGGQTPLWPFALDLHDAISKDEGPLATGQQTMLRPACSATDNVGPIELIVCEKFSLYPWEAKNLAWDEFRTVQLIGAITLMTTLHGVELHKQGANIKARAEEGGARELFVRPLHENRHENDSILHGFYYLQMECR